MPKSHALGGPTYAGHTDTSPPDTVTPEWVITVEAVEEDTRSTVYPPGAYAVFLWADNTTFQARHSSNSGLTALRLCGLESSLASGVTATGTITWSTTSLAITVETG
jgi:hypothetical protein